MSPVALRRSGGPVYVLIDGQSLNNYPAAPYNMPSIVMSGRQIPWANVSVDGTSYVNLLTTVTARVLSHIKVPSYDRYVAILNGGSADVADNVSGATIYGRAETYADTLRAGGFDDIIACTIPPGDLGGLGILYTTEQNVQRDDANARILADAGNAFDATIDVDVPPIDVPLDATYFDNGVHWLYPGALAAAELVGAALTTLLEDDMITPDNLTSFNNAYGTTITAYDQEFEAVSSSLPSGWSWLNQGAATYQEHLGAGVLTMPAGAGVNWRGITRALPTESTWTATAKITASGKYVTGNYIGLLVRENSSGKFIPISRYMVAPGGAGDENVYTDRWTNVTTYGSAITNATMFDRASYFRIRRNSATSYDFEASTDGLAWFPLSLAYDVSAYMTPDQIGLAGNFQGNAVGALALQWFRVR